MRLAWRKQILLAAAATSGLLGFIGYPAIKSLYPVKDQLTVTDDYVDLPTATADLSDIIMPEGIGTGTDVPVDISHWLLLSLLKSKNPTRRERALDELARQRRWNDAECMEIAQAMDRQDVVRLARTMDADIRLFLRPPSVSHIEKILQSNRIEKLVKTVLKDISEKTDSCSSCTSFYTNLSIRVRPDSNVLALNDLNQLDTMMHMESRKRKKIAYNEDVIRLKAVLNNIICGEQQSLKMAKSGVFLALLYFSNKYPDDTQINSLISQILANLSTNQSTKEYLFQDGWIRTLVQYSRSEHLEVSLPAVKALANLDDEVKATYHNHIYLLSPSYRDAREQQETNFDVIFVHGLVGSVFKSWRQGSIPIDEMGNKCSPKNFTPTTELLPLNDDLTSTISEQSKLIDSPYTRCWPKDWLAHDIQGLRVLAVDYPTALSNWRTDCDLNKDTLRQRAIHVMRQLEAAGLGERPIVWVAHSMGGLLVKQILALCGEILQDQRNGQISDQISGFKISRAFLDSVANQTRGIVFYSVPHKGSNLDWIERRNLQKLLLLTTEVIELQKGSPVLLNLHEEFLSFIERPDIDIRFMTFAEINSVSSFGVNKVVQWKGVLVHEDSLQFEVGPLYKLNIDHAHTCKPHSKEALTYARTREFIKDLIPNKVERADEELMPFISFIM